VISLRLTTDLEHKLNKISKNENISKSEIIKRALTLYFEDYHRKHSPYDLGKDLFGKYGSGIGNLSKDYKNILKGKLREKYPR
jgi:RHH-type rel operon transcriptional repressor/antitoxin RelB